MYASIFIVLFNAPYIYYTCCSIVPLYNLGHTDDVTMTPYIMLGVTEGVETYFVPRSLDGVSPPVNVDNFPLGSQVESTVYVC